MKKYKKPIQSKKSVPVESVSENVKTKEYFPVNHKAGILLALIAFILYSNTINFGYVLDDAAAITGNQFVKKGLGGIPGLLTTEFWHFHNLKLGYYRPLSLISFAIEDQFFSGNPQVSHAINALLYAFTAYMLFILLSRIFKTYNFLFSFAISLLFVVHPVHTEVVANLKGRDELLSFLNLILMIWFSLKYQESKEQTHLIFSLLFYYLALLSKESAYIGIALLPVILFFSSKISVKEVLLKSIPYAALVIVFLIQKKIFLGNEGGLIPDDPVNYPYREGSAKISMVFYFFAFSLKLLFFPHPLRYDYSFNQIPVAVMAHPAVFAGIILSVGGALVILKYFKTKSPVVFGLLILYICFSPLLAFIILRGGIFAERLLFFPSLGFSITIVAALSALFKIGFAEKISALHKFIFSKPVFFLLVTGITAFYSIKTFSRNFAWKNDYTLFSTDIKTGENSTQNLRHYGSEILKLAMNEKDIVKRREYANTAIQTFKRAIQIHPKFGECYNQIGVIYKEVLLNFDSAIYYFNEAIKASPALNLSYFNLGVTYQAKGRYDAASFYYNESLKYNPYYTDAIKARDYLKENLGLNVQINPLLITLDTANTVKNSQYYFNQGIYQASRGDYNGAAEQFKQAISLDANSEDSYINLANCYGMLKQYDESIKVSEQLLKINPNNVRALENLAVTYKMMGNTQKSEEYSRMAKALKNK